MASFLREYSHSIHSQNTRRFAAELSVYFHWLFVQIYNWYFFFSFAWAAYSASFLSLLCLTIGCTCLCCTLARLLIVMQRTAATAEWRKCVALGDCNRILRVTRTKTRGPPSPSALESESETEAANARALSIKPRLDTWLRYWTMPGCWRWMDTGYWTLSTRYRWLEWTVCVHCRVGSMVRCGQQQSG